VWGCCWVVLCSAGKCFEFVGFAEAVDDGIDFCSDEFSNEFEKSFIDGIFADDDMMEFIFENLTIGGTSAEDDARLKSSDFFNNVLYPERLEDCDNGSRVFVRASVGKGFKLRANDKSKINFPVDFSFEFDRKYLIRDNGEVVRV